jgi:hypothetical protein
MPPHSHALTPHSQFSTGGLKQRRCLTGPVFLSNNAHFS